MDLTPTELQTIEHLLQNYSTVQPALTSLKIHNGNLDASFKDLWAETIGSPQTFAPQGKSLWHVTLKVLRDEICGDDGFRTKLLDYNKNPASASLLTGVIVYLVELTSLPINPALGTILVLYISKIGLNIFCEYTDER